MELRFPLLQLPPELVAAVVEKVNDATTLQSVALSCQQLQPLAEAALYRNIFFRTGDQANNLLNSFRARADRRKAVQTIDARFQWGRKIHTGAAASIFADSPNLKDLTIESPYCNNNRWRSASGWKQMMWELLLPLYEASTLNTRSDASPRPLQNLVKLTLHLNGDKKEFWDVEGHYSAVFAQPTLQDLTLSSANITDRTVKGMEGLKTSLKRLTLDECNISVQGLHGILSIPVALEYLYIGENHYSAEGKIRGLEKNHDLCNLQPNLFMAALSQQKRSLQTFHYWLDEHIEIGGSSVAVPTPTMGLSAFSSLNSMTIEGTCLFLQHCLTTSSAAPPALSKLSLKYANTRLGLDTSQEGRVGAEDWDTITFNWFAQLPSVLPQLSELQYTFTFPASRAWSVSGSAEIIETIGHALQRKGVRVRMFEGPQLTRYVKPILYGEYETEGNLVYDSAQGGLKLEQTSLNRRESRDSEEGSEWVDDMDTDSEME